MTKSASLNAESETLFLFRFVLYWGQSRSNAEQAQSAESETWGEILLRAARRSSIDTRRWNW